MREVGTLFLFNMLSLTAMIAFVPVVGPIFRALGLAEWQGGVVVAMSGVCWMLSARFWGRKSDQYGRKPVLLVAAAGYSLSYLALAVVFASALEKALSGVLLLSLLVLLRGLVGAFYAAIPSISAARVADVVVAEYRPRAMAMLGAASGLGMVAGPLIGGYLAHDSLTLPLFVSAALPAIALLWLWWKLPADSARSGGGESTSMGVKISDRRVRSYLAVMFLAMSSVVTAQISVGFFAIDSLGLGVHAAARAAGLALLAVGVVLIVVQGIMARINSRPDVCLVIGAGIGMTGFFLVSVLLTPAGLIISYAVSAVGMGMIFPSVQAAVANVVNSDEQGAAAGTLAAVQGLAMVCAPVGATLLYGLSPVAPYYAASLALGVLALVSVQRMITVARYS
ncbi:MFS transporter [Marinobacterium sp. 3-1745]|uniref:MFS transporter n=1 Tax=Marinobacterium marinum TaxID=2756129 RepID=A0A7W1WWY5_9GAMM|nr:MFS transporter [Marinobacterium marinum]